MAEKRSWMTPTALAIGVPAALYFVFYPEDIDVLGQPLVQLSGLVGRAAEPVAKVSMSLSPWLYATLIAVVLAWTATRIWPRRQPAASRKKK